MKKFFLIIFLALASPAMAEDPVDLMALQEAGLSPETIGRYLAQNLDNTRQAPPVSAALLSRLGKYGGDELAASYLNLDKETAHLKRRDFSPEIIERLLASDMGPEKLKKLLETEAAMAAEKAAAPDPPLASSPPQADPQPRFQDLRPGQAADPASKLPPPLDTYELRREPAKEMWMGVTERELPDGHRVEVNRMGNPDAVGQDVIERPSGRRVYRYHSGNTGKRAPMGDQEQERRNREDLMIIHGAGK